MTNRYHTSGAQSEFEPGSDEEVLRNNLGISSSSDMDELELTLLDQLYQLVLVDQLPVKSLTVQDLRDWHRWWLGNVYEWAGQDRTVNMSKGGFLFAVFGRIPTLLADFEKNCLKLWTPCSNLGNAELVEAIAVTHVEFILIHPFREGNGRLSRLLADVMAVQAGHQPLDYSNWDANKTAYIAAIHAGVNKAYGPMKTLVAEAIALGNAQINGPA